MRSKKSRPWHILMVDDDPLVIKVYAERMRFEGWSVAVSRDGWDASQECRLARVQPAQPPRHGEAPEQREAQRQQYREPHGRSHEQRHGQQVETPYPRAEIRGTCHDTVGS